MDIKVDFTLFVFLVSRDCCVALSDDATGLSAVCDCGISRSYSLTIFLTRCMDCHFLQGKRILEI